SGYGSLFITSVLLNSPTLLCGSVLALITSCIGSCRGEKSRWLEMTFWISAFLFIASIVLNSTPDLSADLPRSCINRIHHRFSFYASRINRYLCINREARLGAHRSQHAVSTRRQIASQFASCRDRTLEAMRTQARFPIYSGID